MAVLQFQGPPVEQGKAPEVIEASAPPEWQPVLQADAQPAQLSNQLNASETPPPDTNRVYAYGAIGATLGIAFGLAVASFFTHTSQPATAHAAAANSKIADLAAIVSPTIPTVTGTPASSTPTTNVPADSQSKAVIHKKFKKKVQDDALKYAIEGDDELVDYDASRGIILTSARKTFIVQTPSTVRNLASWQASWQDGSTNMHYKCNLNSVCTLTRKGAPMLYAQLKK